MSSFFSDNEDESMDSLPRQPPRRARDSLPAHASSSSAQPFTSSSSPALPSLARARLAQLEYGNQPRGQNRDFTPSTGYTPSVPGDTSTVNRYNLDDDAEEDEFRNAMDEEDTNPMGEDDYGDEYPDDNDFKKLIRVWMRERGTRDIMPWEGELLENCIQKTEQQAKMSELLQSDPKTSDEEHFKLQLVDTELERVKYVMRSYLRCRLDKVERYSHHITLTPELQSRLSNLELQHATRYTALLHNHFTSSVLTSLPEWLGRFDDVGNDGLKMIREPKKTAPVLIYVLRDCGEVILSDGVRASLEPESTHMIRYDLVENFILRGWVEVL